MFNTAALTQCPSPGKSPVTGHYQVVSGQFGSSYQMCQAHIRYLFISAWILGPDHILGKRFTFFPKLGPKGPDLPVLPSRLISDSCAHRNRHRECKEGISKISLLARNIPRRAIFVLAALSSPPLLPFETSLLFPNSFLFRCFSG